MVEVDKRYVFHGPTARGLVDLFEGRRQLIIIHFMFDPRGRRLPELHAG